MQKKEIRHRIWITERCHMEAERRNRFFDIYFHIILSVYALSSISMSIFIDFAAGGNFENILIFTSVCTLSLSLLVFGFKFGEVAAQHRSCYLDLQKIRLMNFDSDEDLNNEYISILGYYPNHSTYDYMNVVVSSIMKYEQESEHSDGSKVKLSPFSRVAFSVKWVLFWIIILLLGAIPFIAIVYSLYFWYKSVCLG